MSKATMQIQERGSGWVLTNEDKPISVDKRETWEEREALVEALKSRGLHVHSDSSVSREPEEPLFQWTDDPVPEGVTTIGPIKPAKNKPEVRPKKGGKTTALKQAQEAAVAPVESAPAETKRRGRPPKYTPEEAAERRKEQARAYSKTRSEEQKAAARERARRWREKNPDKVKELREQSAKARAERYTQDEEFRAKVNEYQRQYKRAKRTEG